MKEYKKIIIKVGSQVITNGGGVINKKRIKNIVNQIVEINSKGIECILVSSGAVASGKSIYSNNHNGFCPTNKQLLASIGQIELMDIYKKEFNLRNKLCGQILLTKEDFRDREHYLNIKKCFEGLLINNVVPIVNENDVISYTKVVSFTDNDELAGLIGAMLNADAVIILTGVDGIYDGNPNDSKSKLIEKIHPYDKNYKKFIINEKSSVGRGGMITKSEIGSRLSAVGINAHIVNGNKDNIILDLLKNSKSLGTHFIARSDVSNIKKWIAYSKGFEKGSIVINEGLEEKLINNSSISILPIGIKKIIGEFNKGDIVNVISKNKTILASGICEFSSKEAEKMIGKKDQKEFIHYNKLFIN